MVCRSTPGMSVPMGLANIDSGLDDDQIQSLVHQLRHEYSGGSADAGRADPAATGAEDGTTQTAWDRFREVTAARVQTHPGLRPQRRAGLLQRITNADQPPEPDMVYAAERIRDRAVRAARLLDDHLAGEAARVGVPDADTLTTYREHRGDAPRGRQPRATDEQRRAWAGLPLDPRTRHGLAAVADRPDNPDGRHDLIQDDRPVRHPGQHVHRVGYHAASGRLEVTSADGVLLCYRSVDPALAEQLRDSLAPDDVHREQLLGNPTHQYRDAAQAAAAGVRRRCGGCGQFTGATHDCRGRVEHSPAPVTAAVAAPARLEPVALGSAGGAELAANSYPLAHLVDALQQHRGGSITFPLTPGTGQPHLRGDVHATLNGDDDISVDVDYLGCSCDGYVAGHRCHHTRTAGEELRRHLTDQLAASRAQTAAAAAAAVTRPREQVLPDAPDLSTFRYSDDPARFTADVRAALTRAGTDRVPWQTPTDHQPVLYGYGATREFGVEIELDAHRSPPPFGHLDIDQRMQPGYRRHGLVVGRVGRALHERGLTPHDQQNGYHSAVRQGYSRRVSDGWVYENDTSVSGGEVVSPILSNTPEAWQRLQEVCDLVVEHGGIASHHTGAHITVGAPEQAGRAARLNRFLGLIRHHQPDLHLMAGAGYGRRYDYAEPLPAAPTDGYTSITRARNTLNRYRFVNVLHVAGSQHDPGARSSRIEFRLWDGSLEPGRMQAQIRMSTALLDYATRNRDLTFDHDQRAQAGTLNPDHDTFTQRTEHVRGLLDNLFRRDTDKQQAAALWAAGLHARQFQRHPM